MKAHWRNGLYLLPVLAVGLAWWLEIPLGQFLRWNGNAVVWGVFATVPLCVIFLAAYLRPVGSYRRIKDLLLDIDLARSQTVRIGLGVTRDVAIIEGTVDVLEIDALPRERGDRFAERTGFDPRELSTPYRWFRVVPRRIRAWREADELVGRELMRDGRWLG